MVRGQKGALFMDRRPPLSEVGIAPDANKPDLVTSCWIWHRARVATGDPKANYDHRQVDTDRHDCERTVARSRLATSSPRPMRPGRTA